MGKVKGVAQLRQEADRWYSKYVRYRDSIYRDGERYADCITCGVEKNIKQLQAGHFVSRRVNKLRFEETNVNAQCTGCNMFKQGEQYLYAKALDYKYGEGTAENLMSQRHLTHKFTNDELQQIIDDSKTQIKWYEDNKV